MSDQLLSEDTIRLEEAARIGKVHFSTAYRWALRGVPGPDGQRIKLEVIRLGRAWLTSREALARFSARLTPRADGEPIPTPRSATTRQRAAEKAGAVLADAGL